MEDDMVQIRPVSDLRNKFRELKNNDSKVVMSLEEYSRITDMIETKLDEAEIQSNLTTERLTHEEIFDSARNILNDK